MMKSDVFISAVVVSGQEFQGLSDYISEIQHLLSTSYANYEIVIVDNGLDASDLEAARKLLTKLPCIRVIRLSKSFSLDSAIFAGIEAAIGDQIVVLDPVWDSPDAALGILSVLDRGLADIVQGVSSSPLQLGFFEKIGRKLFYTYNRRFLKLEIPSNATYLMALTRRSANSLTSSNRSHRYIKQLTRHIGYEIEEFSYSPRSAKHRSYGLWGGIAFAIEMISSYSIHPLRGITAFAMLAAFANILYAIYVLVIQAFAAHVVEGWTSSSLQTSLMFFSICVVLAVQSEYIGRILVETRREPDYYIMEELESSILIPDTDRKNVSNG